MKLQLHQHSLLTRKVFPCHNLSAQVFFSVSSGSSSIYCHLQVIFIFNSSSYSIHIHMDLDHHLIWIITTGSSLGHHHWCYLNSTHHRKFYRANPFSCWLYSQTSCRSSSSSTLISNHGMNHVRKAYPILTSDHGRNTSKNHVKKAHPTLKNNHGRNTSKTHVRKA